MANTKKTATAKKASVPKAQEVPAVEVAQVQETVSAAPAKQALKLEDSMLINVKSNVFGELLYINKRTGDSTKWNDSGDVQTLSVADIRSMKGNQRAFFENQWVYLDSIEDPGYEDVSSEDIYKALLLSQYYRNMVNPDNYTEIFNWDISRMKQAVMSMSSASKLNLTVAANTCIANGTLDSLKKIKALEECLGCTLDRP